MAPPRGGMQDPPMDEAAQATLSPEQREAARLGLSPEGVPFDPTAATVDPLVLLEQVERLAEDNAEMRRQLAEMRQLVEMRQYATAAAASQPPPPATPLISREEERRRIQAYWADEPKVQIIIMPDGDDRRIYGDNGPWPKMVFRVNGVAAAVPKGIPVNVPASIAALWMHTVNPWQGRADRPPVTFDEVVDQRAQIRARAQDIGIEL